MRWMILLFVAMAMLLLPLMPDTASAEETESTAVESVAVPVEVAVVVGQPVRNALRVIVSLRDRVSVRVAVSRPERRFSLKVVLKLPQRVARRLRGDR